MRLFQISLRRLDEFRGRELLVPGDGRTGVFGLGCCPDPVRDGGDKRGNKHARHQPAHALSRPSDNSATGGGGWRRDRASGPGMGWTLAVAILHAEPLTVWRI